MVYGAAGRTVDAAASSRAHDPRRDGDEDDRAPEAVDAPEHREIVLEEAGGDDEIEQANENRKDQGRSEWRPCVPSAKVAERDTGENDWRREHVEETCRSEGGRRQKRRHRRRAQRPAPNMPLVVPPTCTYVPSGSSARKQSETGRNAAASTMRS